VPANLISISEIYVNPINPFKVNRVNPRYANPLNPPWGGLNFLK
jgi:hypothetical protein